MNPRYGCAESEKCFSRFTDGLPVYQIQFQILAYVGLAMLLGAAIGLERKIEDKPAGLRTHMLVAGAAALLVALSDVMIKHSNVVLGSELVRSDPTRIIQAVITGVSFLGAGTIIRHSSTRQVEGLTTAASILFAAAGGGGVRGVAVTGFGSRRDCPGASHAARCGPCRAVAGIAPALGHSKQVGCERAGRQET